MTNKNLYILSIFLILIPSIGSSQVGGNLEVTKFKLPIETSTHDIVEDKYGFVWIASFSGLWRYDGGNFKNYKRIPNDSTSLTDNYIKCLYEDKMGTLWVGTYGGGLLKYDRDCDCFKRYLHDDNDLKSISFNEIQTIFETSDGKLYIGTDGGGLNIMDRDSGTFEYYKHSPSDSTTITHNNVLSIEEHENGKMFIGTWLGLNVFDPATGKFKRLFHDYSPEAQYHFSLEYYYEKLFTSAKSGLTLNQEDEFELKDIGVEYFQDISQDPRNKCWIAGRYGVSIFSEDFEEINKLSIDRFYDGPDLWISEIFHSNHSDATWLLGQNGHFFLVEEEPKTFNHFLINRTVDDAAITNSNLWFALNESIEIYDKSDYSLIQTVSGFQGATFLSVGNNENVWVADQRYYYEFSNSGEKLNQFLHNSQYQITCLNKTLANQLWSGKILGANRYDISIEKSTFFNCDPNRSDGIGYFHQASIIFQDHLGNLWIGTHGDGLKKFIPDTETFIHYRHDIEDSTSINNNFVNEIFEDRQFNLWIGTNTGLCQLDKSTDTFIQYDFEILSDKSVQSIEQDSDGNLWIGTLNGLVKLDYEDLEYRILNEQDGILSNQIGNGSLRLDQNHLVFETNNGLMIFEPEKVNASKKKPSVYISELWINNELVRPGSKYISKNIEVEEVIKMDYTDSKFEILFEVIHFSNNQRCKYAFKLNEFDNDWIEVTGDPKATYTNIPPGNYTFMVKASNEDGLWNEDATKVEIIIKPAIWQILWIQILGGIVFAVVIFIIISSYIRRERSRTKFEIEKARVHQAEEVTQMKLKFFTNISHELRTPLTLITAPLEKYIRNNEAPKTNVLEMMYKNSQRLLELVNQILDFRKLENKQQPLKVVQQKDLLLFQNIRSAYSYWSQDKEIDFSVRLPKENYLCYFDADIVEKIVANLISNAFKFTPKSGRISLNVEFNEVSNRGNLMLDGLMIIKVKDSGPGIPQDLQTKIFDRFYQLHDSASPSYGSGIGLSLTNELITLHNGTIEIESAKDIGTSFIVKVPIGMDNYNLDQDGQDDELVYPEIDPKSTMILIAEDHEDIRNYLTEELNESYEILEAENGKVALQKAMATIPDIIISDVMMPEINGIQLANQLKNNELTAHIPILFLSAKGSTEHKLEGLETGAEDYIQKPFNIQEIKLKIRNVLETRNLQIDRFKSSRSEAYKEPEENSFLSKINFVIDTNLDNAKFSVEELCTELAIGRSQLYRKILALTGKSIIEYINSYRLSKSLELIRQGEYSIKEVAFKVGYNDNHYFSRSFKKEYGQSPSFYSPKKEKTE